MPINYDIEYPKLQREVQRLRRIEQNHDKLRSAAAIVVAGMALGKIVPDHIQALKDALGDNDENNSTTGTD